VRSFPSMYELIARLELHATGFVGDECPIVSGQIMQSILRGHQNSDFLLMIIFRHGAQ